MNTGAAAPFRFAPQFTFPPTHILPPQPPPPPSQILVSGPTHDPLTPGPNPRRTTLGKFSASARAASCTMARREASPCEVPPEHACLGTVHTAVPWMAASHGHLAATRTTQRPNQQRPPSPPPTVLPGAPPRAPASAASPPRAAPATCPGTLHRGHLGLRWGGVEGGSQRSLDESGKKSGRISHSTREHAHSQPHSSQHQRHLPPPPSHHTHTH